MRIQRRLLFWQMKKYNPSILNRLTAERNSTAPCPFFRNTSPNNIILYNINNTTLIEIFRVTVNSSLVSYTTFYDFEIKLNSKKLETRYLKKRESKYEFLLW